MGPDLLNGNTMPGAPVTPGTVEGALLFARYAFPPNELGYCGPDGASVLLEHATSGGLEEEIVRRARNFDGAWPYLQTISAAAGIDDPLDARVVEAYWIGNELLDRVDASAFLETLGEKFAGQVGGVWDRVGPAGRPLAHHSFHVFAVYPWFGLLRTGSNVPLSVLDQCRIRWGTVIGLDAERALVRSQPLTWDGEALAIGAEREETVRWSTGRRSLRAGLAVGDLVSLHWDWVCDRLTPAQARCAAAAAASDRWISSVGRVRR